MSTMNPTTKEIKDYFIQRIKYYLIHFKHLLIYPWRRYNGKGHICLICVSNDTKKLQKHTRKKVKLYNNLSNSWLQSNFLNMLQSHHPVKENKNDYINTQLDPVIRNLWLYKPIRDIYRQTILMDDSKYYKTYALVRHKCGHRYINMITRSIDKKRFISELKYLRWCNCKDCTAIENKHILLRWFNWKYSCKKKDILKYFRHIVHFLTRKPNHFCIKCVERLVHKNKHHKRNIIMKF